MIDCCYMNIQKPVKLTETQIENMRNLVETCNKHDGLNCSADVDESFNEPDDLNSFLLYQDGRLLSFINLFAPKKSEAELSAFTLPELRRQGLFSRLLKEAKTEILRRGISDILFVCDRKSKDGRKVTAHLGAAYDFSEYLMRYTAPNQTAALLQSQFTIRPSLPEDIETLVELSLLSFDDSREDAEGYIQGIFSSENRIQHVALLGGKIAGMISTALENGKSYIHGLCVFPEYRKKGIGGALLDYKAAESTRFHPDNKIELEVMTENRGALSIYERAGFEVIACYDYSRITASL